MNIPEQIIQSDYMHWAKTLQSARFNLANSGLSACPMNLLPVRLEDLELSGSSFYGWPPLREALATHLKVHSRNLVHAEGTSLANHLVMAALLNPGDHVLVENPTYELLLSTAGYFRTRIHRFNRPAARGFRLDWESIDAAWTPQTRLIVVTDLHNPSSARLTRDDVHRLAAKAATAGAHVLIDEVYLDAAYDCSPGTSFGLADNVVVTGSLTKVYGLSGLRCGWVLAETGLADRIWRLNDLFGVIPAHAAERLTLLVLKHFNLVADRARRILGTNRIALNQFLSSQPDLECSPLETGTVVFPRLRSGRVTELCDRLRHQYETTVAPGHFFGCPDHFRIGIGRDEAETSEGLSRLARALDDLGG